MFPAGAAAGRGGAFPSRGGCSPDLPHGALEADLGVIVLATGSVGGGGGTSVAPTCRGGAIPSGGGVDGVPTSSVLPGVLVLDGPEEVVDEGCVLPRSPGGRSAGRGGGGKSRRERACANSPDELLVQWVRGASNMHPIATRA